MLRSLPVYWGASDNKKFVPASALAEEREVRTRPVNIFIYGTFEITMTKDTR